MTARRLPKGIQIIEKDGKPAFAVLPYSDYLRLLEAAEDAADARFIKAFDASREERVPAEVVDRLLAGENPLRVWREYRRLTQDQLADKAGVSKPYLSQIETGERAGSAVLPRIAAALDLTVDELFVREEAPKYKTSKRGRGAASARSAGRNTARKAKRK
jgi:DNA-binding XRE family transcriptional regulator